MTGNGATLACLTLLVALRVLGQALVAVLGVTWLPPMQPWFSGLIPYPTLLTIQILMLIAMIKIAGDVWRCAGIFAVPRYCHAWSRF